MNEISKSLINCLICKEDRHYYAYGNCEHKGVCIYCSMRMRILYKDKKCPVCTLKLENVYMCDIVDSIQSIHQLEKAKDGMLKDDDFDENGIYYTSFCLKEESLLLRNFICPVKNCNEGSFESMNYLINHMNKVHKRYYCDSCLKDNKKFLSEMNIYNQEKLKEHIEYGEYTESGDLISPPHPECLVLYVLTQLCKLRFFNDELLYKHLVDNHFNCQICKDKKNLIFYEDIPNLSTHYQNEHYVCPYEECLKDIFVVFQTEYELNSHFMTKHKCSNVMSKLTNFCYDESTKKYKKSTRSNQSNSTGFNFSEYIKKLKENMEYYVKNKMHLKDNLYEKSNQSYVEQGIYEGHHNYTGKFDANYSKKPKQNRYDKNNQYYDYYGKQNAGNNYYNNYENNQYYYGNNNNYTEEYYDNNYPRETKKKKNKNNDFYEEVKPVKQGKHDIFQEFAPSSEINYVQENQAYGNKKGNKGKKNKQYTQNTNENKFEVNNNVQNSFNFNTFPVEIKSNEIDKPKNIDYYSVIINFLSIVKEFITQKLKTDKIPKTDCIVAKEVIYQLIVIIGKIENIKDIIEMKSVSHFGYPIIECKHLKELIIDGFVDRDLIFDVLKKVEFKKNFILYKYLDIADKKFNGLFYKLDIEQINEDLYSEFIQDKTKKKGNVFDNSKPKAYTNTLNQLKSSSKIFNDENFPELFFEDSLQLKNLSKLDEETKNKENKPNPLKNILSKDKNVKQIVEPKNKNQKVYSPNVVYESHQPSKLKDLLTQKNNPKKVLQIPKKKAQGGINLSCKEMFPEI